MLLSMARGLSGRVHLLAQINLQETPRRLGLNAKTNPYEVAKRKNRDPARGALVSVMLPGGMTIPLLPFLWRSSLVVRIL